MIKNCSRTKKLMNEKPTLKGLCLGFIEGFLDCLMCLNIGTLLDKFNIKRQYRFIGSGWLVKYIAPQMKPSTKLAGQVYCPADEAKHKQRPACQQRGWTSDNSDTKLGCNKWKHVRQWPGTCSDDDLWIGAWNMNGWWPESSTLRLVILNKN